MRFRRHNAARSLASASLHRSTNPNVRFKNPIIEHFKATAGDRGYQTLISESLRKAVAGESMATELRTVLREELAAYKVRYVEFDGDRSARADGNYPKPVSPAKAGA